MDTENLHVVTGAFGFSGRYIARNLLETGCRVRALTDSYERANTFGGKIKAYPYNFQRPEKLVMTLRGASVLYNNYWVRFNNRGSSYARAIENTRVLFHAAQKAGVRKIVQISVANPSLQSPLEYFRGKAMMERLLIESGLSYSILRPAVIFGVEDVFINNLAWCLRKFPVFCLFGDGSYQLQPIHVSDLARLAVEQGGNPENSVLDAVGPETFTYRGLIEEIARALGKQRKIVPVPTSLGYTLGRLIGFMQGDLLVTRDEIAGLMSNLHCSKADPVGSVKLSEWLRLHALTLGVRYSNELARRSNRRTAYEKL
ncbi:MAG: epimerase [Thermodesulfovibrio sp.]|nr:epimerase [Thermodesulfovibrio sp.]